MLRCKKIKIKQLNLFKHKSVSQRICRPLRDTFGLGKPSFVTSIIIETDVRRQSERLTPTQRKCKAKQKLESKIKEQRGTSHSFRENRSSANYSTTLTGSWRTNWIWLNLDAGLIFHKPDQGWVYKLWGCHVYLQMLTLYHFEDCANCSQFPAWLSRLSQVFSMMFCSVSNILLLFYLFPDVVVIEPTSSTLLQG